ncbi:MAG TPA: glycosyltransferase family 39 protein, partial [Abditibacterium sp.]
MNKRLVRLAAEKAAAEAAAAEAARLAIAAKTAPAARFQAIFSRLNPWILAMCILIGLGCRFYGLNWDEMAQLHPDERFCASLVPRLSAPSSLAQFFDSAKSSLNPANLKDVHYVYGQLPLFIGKIAATLTGKSEGGEFLIVGRFLAALFDAGTVFFTFLIARRLFDAQKALLVAALVAGAALHVQQSHFFVVDPFAAFFLTASFWAGARLVQSEKWLDATLCGLFFGAALACKISAALFGVALLGFLVMIARKQRVWKTIGLTLLCVLATLTAFRVGHPMAFRGEMGFFDLRLEPRFWGDLAQQGGITRGEIDVPFDVQWIGRAPWLFSLRNLGFWGYGWPFLLSGIAGFGLLLRRSRGHGILFIGALFAVVLLGVQGATFSKFTRYFLPLTPFLALLAAFFWQRIESKWPKMAPASLVVALSATLWSVSVASIYARPHTRLEASRWMVQNIPPGTIVASETPWDEVLPLGVPMPPQGGPQSVLLDSYDLDTPRKRDNLNAKLEAADWIVLSSGRSWQNIPRWSRKWPMMTEFYFALFDGRLGFRLEKRFNSFPRLGPLQFPDASAEEALTVYDH